MEVVGVNDSAQWGQTWFRVVESRLINRFQVLRVPENFPYSYEIGTRQTTYLIMFKCISGYSRRVQFTTDMHRLFTVSSYTAEGK